MNTDEAIGIIKEIDGLGRMVIPKEMRELYRLEREVEVIATAEGVLVRNPKYVLVLKRKLKRKK